MIINDLFLTIIIVIALLGVIIAKEKNKKGYIINTKMYLIRGALIGVIVGVIICAIFETYLPI